MVGWTIYREFMGSNQYHMLAVMVSLHTQPCCGCWGFMICLYIYIVNMWWKAQDPCDELLSNQLLEFDWHMTEIQPTLWYLDDELAKGVIRIHSDKKHDELWDFGFIGVVVRGNNLNSPISSDNPHHLPASPPIPWSRRQRWPVGRVCSAHPKASPSDHGLQWSNFQPPPGPRRSTWGSPQGALHGDFLDVTRNTPKKKKIYVLQKQVNKHGETTT